MTFPVRRLLLGLCFSTCSLTPALADDGVKESWEAAYQGKQKIGFQRSLIDRVDANGQAVIHVRVDCKLSIKRFSDMAVMYMAVDSYETLDGRLYAIDSTMKMGGDANKTIGKLEAGGKFKITAQTPGKSTDQIIDWQPDVLGPYAHERLLREKPMKPGETRTYKTFLPEANQIATMTLKALQTESTAFPNGKPRDLLKVESTNDKVPLNTTFWMDDKGDIVKTSTPFIGTVLETFRVNKSEAVDEAGGEAADLGVASLVKPDRPIPRAHNRDRAVTYKLTFGEKKGADELPAASYQEILERKDNVVRINGHHSDPSKTESDKSPGEEFLSPNGFLQSDNPKIRDAATTAIGNATTQWQKATRIERWVHENVTQKDFTVGFATAGEVIETRRGDCTEHAVLLAAMCRAVGVPSRVAMGLVYLESSNVFGYHMWAEVFINGDWIPLDGTLGQGGIGGGHIKLGDSSLKGASALSAFLPIFNVIGKLKIEVEKIE